MQALEAGGSYELVNPVTGRAAARLPAREVFDRIAGAAWESGDPGLVFLDAIARANPTPELGPIEATNPCGEVPLLPFESCVLGSVNLARMVRVAGPRSGVDWDRLRRTIHAAVRFLDDVIEASREPLPEIASATRGNRKIGLGVMGFAECLVRLDVSYDSAAAIEWADRLMGFIAAEARAASRELAELRGVFPNWGRSVYAGAGERIRNATRLSIAPTGTLSIIAGTSGGIEPLFALAYRRAHALGGEPLTEVNPIFLRHVAESGLDVDHVLSEVFGRGTLRGVAAVSEGMRRRFVTALEVPARQHLLIQQAFQRHVDNAVSKTINLPAESSPDEIARLYREAWELGLKGITVYRYGSREGQVLTLGAGEDAAARDLFARCDPPACRL
jgi:ribonucleoside-diphosphate reductase alpha chain